MNGGKIFVSLVFLLLTVACSYGVYAIASMILSGVAAGNWLMVIGGGILAYFFGVILLAGAIIFAILFFISLGTR